MKLSRWGALPGAFGLALGLLGLTGCESKGTFAADCRAVPSGIANPNGTLTASIDTPLSVKAGTSFTLTVNNIGSQDAQTGNPPPADAAAINISGGASPNGEISIGSLSNPAVFPWTRTITVTGQPGGKIDIDLVSGAQISGLFAIICTPKATPARLVSLDITA
jgi:hypothetical protein